jgi:hypothetical protein
VDAGILREKCTYFRRILTDDWNESVEIPLESITPRQFKIVKDWLYGRQPRWFEHYMHDSRGGPPAEVEFNAEDQWPSSAQWVHSWKSHYCRHLCRLWIHGSCFGEAFEQEVIKRLRKITLDDPAGAKRTTTTGDEPDWTSAFVLDPVTLHFVYDNTADEEEDYSPLRTWAIDVVASRLNMTQLHAFSKNDLPKGYLSTVYQTRYGIDAVARYKEFDELLSLRRELKDQKQLHCREIEEAQNLRKELKCKETLIGKMSRKIDYQKAAHERMCRELKEDAQFRHAECFQSGCTPNRHSPYCKLDILLSRELY